MRLTEELEGYCLSLLQNGKRSCSLLRPFGHWPKIGTPWMPWWKIMESVRYKCNDVLPFSIVAKQYSDNISSHFISNLPPNKQSQSCSSPRFLSPLSWPWAMLLLQVCLFLRPSDLEHSKLCKRPDQL